jgi:small conductance mechanosensitive channel
MNQDFWLEVKNRFVNFITQIGPNILYAVVALLLGVFAIKFSMRILKRVLRKSNVESSL